MQDCDPIGSLLYTWKINVYRLQDVDYELINPLWKQNQLLRDEEYYTTLTKTHTANHMFD